MEISQRKLNRLLRPLGIKAVSTLDGGMYPQPPPRSYFMLNDPIWILQKQKTKERIGIKQSNGALWLYWWRFQDMLDVICDAKSECFFFPEKKDAQGKMEFCKNPFLGCSSIEEMQIKKDLFTNG